MINAEDVQYSEELYENLSINDIHGLAVGEIIIWCSGSGAGEGRSYGSYYLLLDDGKGHCKYLEEDVSGASPNQAMLDGAFAAVGMIKKPSNIRLISSCPLGFKAGFRGKGPNADRVQRLLELVKEKGHSLAFSLADADVIKGWITENGGKKFEYKDDKYKRVIYAECIERVIEVLEENGVGEDVITQVRGIRPTIEMKRKPFPFEIKRDYAYQLRDSGITNPRTIAAVVRADEKSVEEWFEVRT